MDSSIIARYLEKIFFSISPVTLAIVLMLATWIFNYNRRRARMVRLINKIPGPPSLPIVGKFLEFNVKTIFVDPQTFQTLISGNAVEINVEHDGEYTHEKVYKTVKKKTFRT